MIFKDHRGDQFLYYDHERTFSEREIVFADNVEETVKGFLDMEFPNGDVAIGIPIGAVEITEA